MTRITTHDNAVDHGAVCGRAGVSAVGGSSHEVVGQPGAERRNASEMDLEWSDVGSTEHEAMPLVEDGVALFDPPCEIRIVGILAGDIRIHIVDRMGPRVAEQHG